MSEGSFDRDVPLSQLMCRVDVKPSEVTALADEQLGEMRDGDVVLLDGLNREIEGEVFMSNIDDMDNAEVDQDLLPDSVKNELITLDKPVNPLKGKVWGHRVFRTCLKSC